VIVLDVIERKRDGMALTAEHWNCLLDAVRGNELRPYQLAAFRVAAAVRGMNREEGETLARLLEETGVSADRLELPGIGVERALHGGRLPSASRPYHDLLRRKIAGEALSSSDIETFVRGVRDGEVEDEEIAAFCMAVFLNGMTQDEVLSLTQSMLHSGEVLQWEGLPGPTVDKHSTGGVGDKVSLPLTGVLVACGAYVPMISGRGLGHTGGTLDKLQSIPGYRIDLSPEEMRRQVHEVHAVITGQTGTLAPADRRLYAIRDVTGTVSSIPLITASILSKKLAEGLQALVLDVKVGSGAFMETQEDAERLAESLSRVGTAAGVQVSALLTHMDQPLGMAVGNANEVVESVACLRGEGPPDLEHLVVALAARLLYDTRLAPTLDQAARDARESIRSGRAFQAFRRMVDAQGGDVRVIDDPSLLPVGPLRGEVQAPADGHVQRIDARTVGRALIALGGGRMVQEDTVDPSVGIWLVRKVGARVSRGDTILELAATDRTRLEEAVEMLRGAIQVGSEPAVDTPLILSPARVGRQ